MYWFCFLVQCTILAVSVFCNILESILIFLRNVARVPSIVWGLGGWTYVRLVLSRGPGRVAFDPCVTKNSCRWGKLFEQIREVSDSQRSMFSAQHFVRSAVTFRRCAIGIGVRRVVFWRC